MASTPGISVPGDVLEPVTLRTYQVAFNVFGCRSLIFLSLVVDLAVGKRVRKSLYWANGLCSLDSTPLQSVVRSQVEGMAGMDEYLILGLVCIPSYTTVKRISRGVCF